MSRLSFTNSNAKRQEDTHLAHPTGLGTALSVHPEMLPARKAQPTRRFFAAWLYDYLACFWLSVGAVSLASALISKPVADSIPLLVVTASFYLTRDFYFEGRGIGKNFLGMQVIDVKTGCPASLMQSIVRNLVIFAPYFIFQFAVLLFHAFPMSCSETILSAIKTFGFTYFALILFVENFGLYIGHGRRLADHLAGTMVVKQVPDFRNPFSIRRIKSADFYVPDEQH